MTAIDLDALEAVTKAVGPLPLDRQWTQREVIRAHQICLHAPALIAEHRALLARVAELEKALQPFADLIDVTEYAGLTTVRAARAALEPKP